MAHGATCTLAIVVSVSMAGAPLSSSGTVTNVPFELYQHHLVVAKGSIGPLTGLNVLIDTGTIPSVVANGVARKLHLQAEPAVVVAFGQQARTKSAAVDAFRIGSLESGTIRASVGDLSYLAGVRVDAIAGLDVLARSNFSVDYRTKMLRFGPDARDDVVAPFQIVWPFVTVTMTIAGEPVRLLVDTGSRDLVLFKSRMPKPLSRPPWKGDKTVQYASGPARLLRLELRDAALGTHAWNKLTAWSLDRALDGYPPDIDGVLGVSALGCQRVRFDFERNELGWTW